jgi:hypothetical protein
MTGTIVTAAPQAAALPWQLPKTQPEWQAFINSLNSWRSQAPAWQALALQNSWVAYGTPYASAQYQIDLNGRVSLRGLIKSGTVTDGTVLATLPYAPSFEIATVALGNSGSAYSPVRLDVTTAGNILIYGASAFSGSYFVSLDQLSFSLAQ